jgi:DNA-binding PadR family transcriptional regulator
MSGYDLKTLCFDHDAAHFWTADQAQIYRTLERLEARALVSSKVRRQRSRPDRKVYTLTQPGAEELDRWASTIHPLPPLRDPFLIQLRFAGELSDELLLDLLRSHRVALQDRLDTSRERLGVESRGQSREVLLHRLTLEYTTTVTRAAIDWVDDSISSIETAIEQDRPTAAGVQRRLFSPRTQPKGSAS